MWTLLGKLSKILNLYKKMHISKIANFWNREEKLITFIYFAKRQKLTQKVTELLVLDIFSN